MKGLIPPILCFLMGCVPNARAGDSEANPKTPIKEADQVWDLDLAGIGKMEKIADANNESLNAVLSATDRIVVFDTPLADSRKVLFESKSRKDIDELQKAIEIVPPERWHHCMCIGGPALQFWRGEVLLMEATVHHGQSLRTSLWSSDADFANQERLLAWFDARGMSGPRYEVEEAKQRSEEFAQHLRRWSAAAPPPLRTLWKTYIDGRSSIYSDEFDLAPWHEALAREIADPNDRILSLLAWFGSGAGPWLSGYPGYEILPKHLLREYPVGTIAEAVNKAKLSERQLEGTARFFATHFRKDEAFVDPDLLALLSEELKNRLLRHCMQSTDRAHRVFGHRAFAANP